MDKYTQAEQAYRNGYEAGVRHGTGTNVIGYNERVRIYADALEAFDVPTQLVVALEELSEAQKEICKALRGKVDLDHLAEEVADATIMLEQVRFIFGINSDVCEAMDRKVLRLRRRIKNAKK